MQSPFLLHHLIFHSAHRNPSAEALFCEGETLSYQKLASFCRTFAEALVQARIPKQERVAIFLEKRFEFVVAAFGSACAGNIFVPINPILKIDQVRHILKDSGAYILVTSNSRLAGLLEVAKELSELRQIIVVDLQTPAFLVSGIQVLPWSQFFDFANVSVQDNCSSEHSVRAIVDQDAVAILYTSGSTGFPKGVVLSHRNMVFGAKNVASYLENWEGDRLLSALPLSFDAGFSQLTTAFHVGASVVLLNYLSARDVQRAVTEERITGLTAVPPLWIQLADLSWSTEVTNHLRYIANTGGKLPKEILKKLRQHFPNTKPYLMYGLTESFRSTYLPPDQIDRRPDSVGKAIPNAEILVLRPDGSPCAPGEDGELIHRGALVGLGYWNDPERTNERYKPLPLFSSLRPPQIVLPEICVFSGDLVRMDEDGYLYFVGRNDDMIKTSGYRVSPVEIEEALYTSGLVKEIAAFAAPHPVLGQKIVISVLPLNPAELDLRDRLLQFCRHKFPSYMVPSEIDIVAKPHPRNQNEKLDRPLIRESYFQKIALAEAAT